MREGKLPVLWPQPVHLHTLHISVVPTYWTAAACGLHSRPLSVPLPTKPSIWTPFPRSTQYLKAFCV